MSIVIIGGHDRMVCRYKTICKEFNCDAKVYTQPSGNLENMIGHPHCIILFTNPISHKMAKIARNTATQNNIPLYQSHNGSGSALRSILGNQIEAEI
ncbi:MAG: DUF2325 domain-containing protein [Clostridiales Family XIII bacterium]|jgi:hypothetical protein|nr:DUF2325 domain-containing protein [Clostridiales Family XIII bacterium]